MRIKGFIAKLLLICFSAFLGHNLVPHHHHAEVYPNPMATQCPFEHGDHQGHDQDNHSPPGDHPVHCHAFNDVVFQKFNIPSIRPWCGQIHSAIIPDNIQIAEVKVKSSSLYTFFKLPGTSQTDLGTRALRAPPARA